MTSTQQQEEPQPVSSKPRLTATCHCKAVSITFPTPEVALNECQCTICGRYGGLWAYFQRDEVEITGHDETQSYIWGNEVIEFRRCRRCGCVTHWEPLDKTRNRIGINCRMLEMEVRDGFPRRRYSWSGK